MAPAPLVSGIKTCRLVHKRKGAWRPLFAVPISGTHPNLPQTFLMLGSRLSAGRGRWHISGDSAQNTLDGFTFLEMDNAAVGYLLHF